MASRCSYSVHSMISTARVLCATAQAICGILQCITGPYVVALSLTRNCHGPLLERPMKGCPARKEGWSPERYARFEKAWHDGVEIELMRERFGITANAILLIAKRLGLPMKVVRTR